VIAKAIAVGALGTLLASCAGVYGPKGNDTGGIIPWSPDNERMALTIAQDNCGRYRKHAVINTIHRTPGNYIVYDCRFEPPRRKPARR